MGKKESTNCEYCIYFQYDEDDESYECQMSLDEDEMLRYLKSENYNCPYFQLNDEYGRARKQI